MNEFLSYLLFSIVQLMAFCLIPLIWWMITDRKTNFFKWIGLKKPSFKGSKLKILAIIVIAVALYIGAMYIIMSTLLKDVPNANNDFSGKGIKALPLILVYAIIRTSLSEELFFRGFLCKRLTKSLGFVAGNIIQALLFGLMHGVPFGLATHNLIAFLLLTLLPGGIGYLQGWLNEKKAGGSIFPSWFLHGLMNALSAFSTI